MGSEGKTMKMKMEMEMEKQMSGRGGQAIKLIDIKFIIARQVNSRVDRQPGTNLPSPQSFSFSFTFTFEINNQLQTAAKWKLIVMLLGLAWFKLKVVLFVMNAKLNSNLPASKFRRVEGYNRLRGINWPATATSTMATT